MTQSLLRSGSFQNCECCIHWHSLCWLSLDIESHMASSTEIGIYFMSSKILCYIVQTYKWEGHPINCGTHNFSLAQARLRMMLHLLVRNYTVFQSYSCICDTWLTWKYNYASKRKCSWEAFHFVKLVSPWWFVSIACASTCAWKIVLVAWLWWICQECCQI